MLVTGISCKLMNEVLVARWRGHIGFILGSVLTELEEHKYLVVMHCLSVCISGREYWFRPVTGELFLDKHRLYGVDLQL